MFPSRARLRACVRAENSNPAILMMWSAKKRRGNVAADLKGTPKWRTLVQRQVRTTVTVPVAGSGDRAKDDDMIDALTSHRHGSLYPSVLPRSGCCRPVRNAHGANALNESSTVDPMQSTDHT